MKTIGILLFLLSFKFPAFTQHTLPVKVLWNNQAVHENDTYEFRNGHLNIAQLKFYLSAFSTNETEKPTSFFLYSLDQEENNIVLPKHLAGNKLCFTIGIDSTINAGGVMGDILDPTQGMYWTWQSGFINFKFEATFDQRKIEYHLGGYAYPYNSSRHVCLNSKTKNPTLVLHLDRWFEDMQRDCPNNIMSPGELAMKASNILSTCFELQ